MNRFEEPEIKVIRFYTPDVMTDSCPGYENETDASFCRHAVFGGDGDIPL